MWATRSGVHVDRAACAWLVGRFIDTEAAFVFVDDPDEVPEGATAFDMRGAQLSHHGGDCSFETMLRYFGLDDPVLWDVARVVHEADLTDDRFDAPEAAGLDVLRRGLSMPCWASPAQSSRRYGGVPNRQQTGHPLSGADSAPG
jgi:hypothetical protein